MHKVVNGHDVSAINFARVMITFDKGDSLICIYCTMECTVPSLVAPSHKVPTSLVCSYSDTLASCSVKQNSCYCLHHLKMTALSHLDTLLDGYLHLLHIRD
jgi:hypothetical protein